MLSCESQLALSVRYGRNDILLSRLSDDLSLGFDPLSADRGVPLSFAVVLLLGSRPLKYSLSRGIDKV